MVREKSDDNFSNNKEYKLMDNNNQSILPDGYSIMTYPELMINTQLHINALMPFALEYVKSPFYRLQLKDKNLDKVFIVYMDFKGSIFANLVN